MKTFRLICILLSFPSFLIFLLMGYDSVFPATEMDTAIISEREITRGKGRGFYIYAKGNYAYRESVDIDFYLTTQVNDTIIVHLSKFFKEWKTVELIHNGQKIATSSGEDIFYMRIFCFAFLLPLLSFTSEDILRSNIVFITLIIVWEFVTVSLLIRFLLVWIGLIDKV